jgi:hypothetical protein
LSNFVRCVFIQSRLSANSGCAPTQIHGAAAGRAEKLVSGIQEPAHTSWYRKITLIV